MRRMHVRHWLVRKRTAWRNAWRGMAGHDKGREFNADDAMEDEDKQKVVQRLI